MTKNEAIEKAQSQANTPKDRLISIYYDLLDAGAVRKANSLETIIAKLEAWQNS